MYPINSIAQGLPLEDGSRNSLMLWNKFIAMITKARQCPYPYPEQRTFCVSMKRWDTTDWLTFTTKISQFFLHCSSLKSTTTEEHVVLN